MARLTAAQRNKLPTSAFAGPGRSYPVEDAAHAQDAKAMAARFGSPALQAKVAAKVSQKFPTFGKGGGKGAAMAAAKRKKHHKGPMMKPPMGRA